jgi:HAD superfamily hydrolase (TIGR01450 family)
MIQTTLSQLLTIHQPSAFLIDASGVIYNDDGYIPNMSHTLTHLMSIGPIFIATNNSSQSPQTIRSHFKKINIHLDETQILSSGLGLRHNSTINALISAKKCYVVGYPDSLYYVHNAGGIHTPNISEAECIILTASINANIREEHQKIIHHCKDNPTIPLICCNPDRHVRGPNNTRISVIGHYAKMLEIDLKNPFYWFGKPHPNYSAMVKTQLANQGISTTKSILFFDDNPQNIIQMQHDLGITGCLIKDTGISHLTPDQDLITLPAKPKYAIPALTLIP